MRSCARMQLATSSRRSGEQRMNLFWTKGPLSGGYYREIPMTPAEVTHDSDSVSLSGFVVVVFTFIMRVIISYYFPMFATDLVIDIETNKMLWRRSIDPNFSAAFVYWLKVLCCQFWYCSLTLAYLACSFSKSTILKVMSNYYEVRNIEIIIVLFNVCTAFLYNRT